MADKICVSSEKTLENLPHKLREKAVVTYSPIRNELTKGDKESAIQFLKKEASKKRNTADKFEIKSPVILIMGGSTGAERLNEMVWKSLPELLKKHTIIHVTGKGKGVKDNTGSPVLTKLSECSGAEFARYFEFEYIGDELADIYALADFAICRAGAGTVAELNALCLPAILIPLQIGSRGDQMENALNVGSKANAILDEKTLTHDEFIDEINSFAAELQEKRKKENFPLRENILSAAKNISKVVLSVPGHKSILNSFALFLTIALLILLPFHAFGTVFLNYGLGLEEILGTSVIISMWKEGVLILLALLLGLKFLKEKSLPKLDLLDKVILGYILFGLVHYLISLLLVSEPASLSQLIWGARYDYIFLVAFLIIRHFRFEKKDIKKIFKAAIIGGIWGLGISYIIHYLLTPENLTLFGFRNDWSTWYPGQSLAFCQRIENQELCRMSGTFAGPNQLGAYLVLLYPLFFMWKKKRTKIILLPIMIAAFFALFITYSRGALIGMGVALIVLMTSKILFKYEVHKYLKVKYFAFGFIGIIVLGLILFFVSGDMLIRPESTSEHLSAWLIGIDEIIRHPLGQGLGSAGPASYRFGTPIIPESWYLQVGVELGLVGLAFFLTTLGLIAKALIRKKHFILLASFIGVLTICFFLHTLEDSAVSITLFILLGSVLNKATAN